MRVLEGKLPWKETDLMNRTDVQTLIEEVGIVPGIRLNSAETALYAAEALFESGIPVAEITMTVPGAVEVIQELVRRFPEMAVGAGTVLDAETATLCLKAGARFITSTGLVSEVVNQVRESQAVNIPGALTPSEVIAAWKAGADYVKIYPAGSVGGDLYLRSLKLPLPQIRLIAAGGVNQQTAVGFIRAGASALGVGSELLPKDALAKKQGHRIQELGRRFLSFVKEGRQTVE